MEFMIKKSLVKEYEKNACVAMEKGYEFRQWRRDMNL
jgi:hypothetical protein